MKVSIIIPIYNASKYLVRCLDSVVAQTFCELECILVDDCGKDDSVAIAEKYIQEYNGPICFHLLHHDSNKGAATAYTSDNRKVIKVGVSFDTKARTINSWIAKEQK
jgi:glycosyltransferase involved in cell wall biosynthesis